MTYPHNRGGEAPASDRPFGGTTSRVLALETGLFALVGGLTVGIALLVGLLAWWLSRRISRPLQSLSEDRGRIQDFQLDGQVAVATNIREVVTMKESLET